MVFVIGLVFAFIFGAGIGAYFQRREDQKEAVLEGHGHFDPVTGCFAFGASCEAQELDALKLDLDEQCDANIQMADEIEEHKRVCPLNKKKKKAKRVKYYKEPRYKR